MKYYILWGAEAEMRNARRGESDEFADAPLAGVGASDGDLDASNAFRSCASRTATRRRMPSHPNKSAFVLST